MRSLFAAILICMACSLFADTFYEKPPQGWYWYDESEVLNEESSASPVVSQSMTLDEAKSSLEKLQKELEDKKVLAIMNPTESNLKAYMQVQKEANYKAEVFAANWQRTLIKNPELDYSLEYPTNSIARKVYLSEKEDNREITLNRFAKTNGLFFFFRSNCPYCHQFAPILKQFETKYGVTVIPISLDGHGLPDYPSPKQDSGFANAMNVEVVPAIIAINPKTKQATPVSYGMASFDELLTRIHLIETEGGL